MCFGQFEVKCRHTDTYGLLRKIKLIWTFWILNILKSSPFFIYLSQPTICVCMMTSACGTGMEEFDTGVLLFWFVIWDRRKLAFLGHRRERFVRQQPALGHWSFHSYIIYVCSASGMTMYTPLHLVPHWHSSIVTMLLIMLVEVHKSNSVQTWDFRPTGNINN